MTTHEIRNLILSTLFSRSCQADLDKISGDTRVLTLVTNGYEDGELPDEIVLQWTSTAIEIICRDAGLADFGDIMPIKKTCTLDQLITKIFQAQVLEV